MMVAEQVRDYLLDGTIRNSVNFLDVMPRESLFRWRSQTRMCRIWSAGSLTRWLLPASISRR